ncbi:ABC transporter substrate-binding protein [Caldimonas thermodepolymerans]|uniref:NitT/TauT family transport system substrate-binding protein n=1 Tax=Caldimonas thermodepolymerans TaxID=215580 RepID=A0A2S5T3N0_9BURK|nr:ABC transporter substrate-binding protein [Caldimonas thermodepolymerans]PPE69590.1 nitrate ABC transporter substrate-binding protein [Caldimonas thermodepolymerans]QPC30894.1 ABC transporter substrate-binding protein [Caldimonas thermodepolymerans]RDH97101.1 NitT/TauT family transport system substrate-binding protein [Caldimonas thermodepolymerans]TCP08997.1 NitT/TauT family transport system substrate-binding protein [Caldimonas thermodepolymerans]UZG47298.1 ABC transporter substrate-bindi
MPVIRSSARRRFLSLVLAASGALGLAAPAHAEGRLRIAEQYGVVYLLLNVAQDQKLIEKHGKAQGIDIQVEFVKLSGGAAINEALLSGSIDVAGAGIGPLLTLWDRTRGRQNVKGIAALGNFPYYLVTNNPAVRTIADFTDKDRIATPAVGVSVQSRILQLASAKAFGYDQYNKLDKLQVALPHPEAAAAIIKGGTEVTTHFASPPFQEQELAANPNARVVLKSYDVLGGPSSATALYATERFRQENPKTYKAFVDALAEAARLIKADPEQAADIFLRVNKSGIDRKLLLQIIRSPEVEFTLTPQNTYALAEFMHRVGAIKHRPASAREYFFDDPHNAAGS